MENLILLPQPRSVKITYDQHLLNPEKYILLHLPQAETLLATVHSLQATLRQTALAPSGFPISAATSGPVGDFGIILELVDASTFPDQGYRLEIALNQIWVKASNLADIYYGVATLKQIAGQSGTSLPTLVIEDWPDFSVRGFMLDINRDKVPTLKTLLHLIDKLASWKINQIQLYTEHTFQYLNHPEVWQNSSAMTGQEILELDRSCRERFIELVPNQNSFAHLTLLRPSF